MLLEYIKLIDYCNNRETFDSSIFEFLSKEYTFKYKKLDYQEQGKLAEDIHIHFENYKSGVKK